MGYFLYDLVAMAYLGLLDKGMFIHHSFCINGMYITLVGGISASYPIHGLFVTEISNPIMHVRMVIKHLGMRYTKAYEFAEISYILLFIYGRIILGTSVVIKTTLCSENNYLVRLSAIGIVL